MATHIIQIGKHKFVCGLFWQSLSRPRDLQREATELARKIDADLMVIRKDNAIAQAGFASARDGVRKGMCSLAAVVSKTIAIEGATYDGQQQQAHNWLSAFKLPDGKWAYFAVRDANFLPNGDFAGTKDEVLERLHGDYGLGGWNVVIGDKELEEQGFHNFCVKQIEDLIPHKKNGRIKEHNWWRLRSVRSVNTWLLALAILSLIGLLSAIGFYFWQQHQEKLAAEERAAALELARRKKQGETVPVVASHPWPLTPLPLALTQACLDKMGPVTPGGWQLEVYSCSASNVTYTWSRSGSTLNYLLEKVPAAQAELNGEKATHSEALPLPTGQDEDLVALNEILLPLQSKFQLLGLPLALSITPPVATDKANGPIIDWRTVSFSVSGTTMPPTDIARLLNRPGIRINNLTYRNGMWSIEGAIYAK